MSWKSKHTSYIASLNPVRQAAITHYINSGYKINNLLISGLDTNNPTHCKEYKICNYINNLEATIQEAPRVVSPPTLFRGINSKTLGDQILQEKAILHPHFMSTSDKRSVAHKNFAGEKCCVFEIIHIHPEVDFLWVSKSGTSENEVIFNRKTWMILKDHKIKQGKTTFYVEINKSKPKSKTVSISMKMQSVAQDVVIGFQDVVDELSFLSGEPTLSEQVSEISKSFFELYHNILTDSLQLSIIKQIEQHLLEINK